MIWAYKILAIVIIAWAIPTAFDPKYRYNEHSKWEPGLLEILWILSLGLLVIGAILA